MRRTKLLLVAGLSAGTTTGGLSAQEGLSVWTVDREPTLRMGVVEGLDSETFVRVSDAALLPGGGVVVLDAGAHEIRFFDSGGGALTAAGREGEGPGEVLDPLGLEVRGDSALVWDARRGTIASWTFAGELLDERIVSHHRTFHEGDLLPDGSLLIPRYPEAPPDPSGSGSYRVPAELVRYAAGEVQDLGPFPWVETRAGDRMGIPIPYGSRSSAAGGGTPLRIFVTDDTRQPHVREYDGAGTLTRAIQLLDVRERLGASEWSAILDTLPTMRGQEEAIRRLLDDMDLPDRTSWVDRLMVDPRGRLWAISRRSSGATLAVVYEDGAPLARVELPEVVRLLEIGDDRIVAVERDALDVETVAVYRFRER